VLFIDRQRAAAHEPLDRAKTTTQLQGWQIGMSFHLYLPNDPATKQTPNVIYQYHPV